MSYDSLGDRMKTFEAVTKLTLPIKLPLILRLDGKSFHSYTKKCQRPVDVNLVACMNATAQYLCENIQGAQIAYVQSDEISLLINNYQTRETQPWLGNSVQKMVSISAGMASAYFSMQSGRIFAGTPKLAVFDSRIFLLPKEEVNNYFLWRQQDCTRNSVQMLARTLYSHKELFGKNNAQLQDLCMDKGHNWNDCSVPQKRGRCIVKTKTPKTSRNPKTGETVTCERMEWMVDENIPIFSQDKNYLEKYL